MSQKQAATLKGSIHCEPEKEGICHLHILLRFGEGYYFADARVKRINAWMFFSQADVNSDSS